MAAKPAVRFRVDFGRQCSLGVGKIELLERIAACGSLSEAARRMHMSYRRAWLLLADLNASFAEPAAICSTGGRGGGGAVLTPFGERLVSGYRRMETALQPMAEAYFREVSERVRPPGAAPRGRKTVLATSLKRKAPPRRRPVRAP